MDKRPLAPTGPPKPANSLYIEPLENFGPYFDRLSPAARQLVLTTGSSMLEEQWLRNGQWRPAFERPRLVPGQPCPPPEHRRQLHAACVGFVVTGPIRPHHLAYFAGKVNQAVRSGEFTYGCLVKPQVMMLAHGHVQVGLHEFEWRPLRYAILFYPYTRSSWQQLQAQAQQPNSWYFGEGGMPPDFPEHLYAGVTIQEAGPEQPTPPGYWRACARQALGWAMFAAASIALGIGLAM